MKMKYLNKFKEKLNLMIGKNVIIYCKGDSRVAGKLLQIDEDYIILDTYTISWDNACEVGVVEKHI